jgi:hypothetical protein
MNDERANFASEAAQVSELMNVAVEQIRRLAELHKDGVLTDEEFATKKKEMLSRI